MPQVSETPRDHVSLRTRHPGLHGIRSLCKNVLSALKTAQNVHNSYDKPPVWTPFDASDTCQRCANKFSWHSTFTSASSEARERHNCRNCGDLVCGPCSSQRQAIPRLGLSNPVRVCIKCYLMAVAPPVRVRMWSVTKMERTLDAVNIHYSQLLRKPSFIFDLFYLLFS